MSSDVSQRRAIRSRKHAMDRSGRPLADPTAREENDASLESGSARPAHQPRNDPKLAIAVIPPTFAAAC